MCVYGYVSVHVGVAKAPCPRGKDLLQSSQLEAKCLQGKHWFLIRLIIWTVMDACLLFYSILEKLYIQHQIQQPNFVISTKFPADFFWERDKNQIAGLNPWEFAFLLTMDQSTWIDQIWETWSSISFWRGKKKKTVQDNWLSYLSLLDINASFLQHPSFTTPGLLFPQLQFSLMLHFGRGLDQNPLLKGESCNDSNPAKGVKSTFDLFVALFWSACCFEAHAPLFGLQVLHPCWPSSLLNFLYLSFQMGSRHWWLHPAAGEV